MTGQTAIEDATARVAEMEARAVETAELRRALQEQAAARLGGLLRQLRTERWMGTRRLAERAAATRNTICRLENGTLRPQLSLLRAVANGLDPDHRLQILDQLVAVAAPILAPEIPAGQMYRARRMFAGTLAGKVPLPSPEARSVRLQTAGNAMWAAARALTNRAADILDVPDESPLTLEPEDLQQMLALDRELRAEADKLLAAGGVEIRGCGGVLAGDEIRPLRRRRGDPPDVSPDAPPLDDLKALSRWVREWQVRESRRMPSTARERAIAATGERERAAVRDIPGREKIVYHTEDSGTLPHYIET